MFRWIAAILAPFIALAAIAQVDVQTIIERSVQTNDKDWKAAPAYSFSERDVQNGHTRNVRSDHDSRFALPTP